MSDKKVAVILARGGSKGIPNKNIMTIKKKPLLYYSIETALKSDVDEVWVSTDCPKIKWVAEYSGARVLDRPQEYAEDTSSSEDALLHFARNVEFDVLVFIQPTSPLLTHDHVNSALKKIDSTENTSIVSVYEEHWLPRWKNYGDEGGVLPDKFSLAERPRRQDVPLSYVENGALYVTRKQMLLDSDCRVSGRIQPLIMKYSESFQVDTMDDVYIIEKLLGGR